MLGYLSAEAPSAQALSVAVTGASASGRVIGVSMREFIHRDDERQLSLALKHVTNEAYADEGLRRYVLGLRFKTPPLDSLPQGHAAHARRAQGEHNSAGRSAAPCIAHPVEILPCGGNLYGQVFAVFVFPLADDNTPDAILRALELLGSDLVPLDSFKPAELADEVDRNGGYKWAAADASHSRFFAAVSMVG